MKRLTAIFNISPTYPPYAKRAESDVMRYELDYEGYDVVVELNSERMSRAKKGRERYWSFGIDTIVISVSKDESRPVPDVEKTESGGRSYVKRMAYFDKRIGGYSKAAYRILERLILFFRYRLNNPLVRVPSIHDDQIQNPRWIDDEGTEYRTGKYTLFAHPEPGLQLPFCGARHLTKSEDRRLMVALQKGIQIGIHEEVLSDARDAVSVNNFRRAAIELALAIELAIKRVFFSEDSAAGHAFEYLEDKGSIRVKIIDLLGGPSERAFGENFSVTRPKEFAHLEEIFQARNKAAHRGSLTFRDKQGRQHVVDRMTINKWWKSVDTLFDWLSRQSV